MSRCQCCDCANAICKNQYKHDTHTHTHARTHARTHRTHAPHARTHTHTHTRLQWSAIARLKVGSPQNSLHASIGASSSGQSPKNMEQTMNQAKQETKGNSQLCGSRVGTSGQCVLATQKTYPRSMMPEKQLLSTVI